MIRLLARPAATTTAVKHAIISSGTTSVSSFSPRLPVTVFKKDRQKRTMSATGTKATAASPYKIHITPENTGLLKVTQTEEVAEKASTLLQEDLESHHVFFNDDGYHNHIPHQILALYGTSATSPSLQKGYTTNTVYQRPAKPPHKDVLTSLFQSWTHAQPYLGKEEHYPDFLAFFQREIETAGPNWEEEILSKYLFKTPGDAAGDDMLVRLYSGFMHPLIQLMYGVEWKQPAIVAEGLAQAAVHGADIGGFLLEAERRAGGRGEEEMGDILGLFERVGGEMKLRNAVRVGDANRVRDGVLARAREEILEIASRVRVRAEEGEVERRTAEMFDACVFVASSAALREGKVPKFDFFLIHHVNASPFFLTLNGRSWLPIETKARILEWKIRMDLLQYAARAVPTLSVDKIAGYKPKKSQQSVPSDIISRLHTFQDDGHAIKLGRSALICHDLVSSLNRENKLDGVKLAINSEELWNKVFHLAVDSVEGPGPHMVMCAGLAEAWEDVPDAKSDNNENHKL